MRSFCTSKSESLIVDCDMDSSGDRSIMGCENEFRKEDERNERIFKKSEEAPHR